MSVEYEGAFAIDPLQLCAAPDELVAALDTLCSEGVPKRIPASLDEQAPVVVVRPAEVQDGGTVEYSFVTTATMKGVLKYVDVSCITANSAGDLPLAVRHHREVLGKGKAGDQDQPWGATQYGAAKRIIKFARATQD